MGEMKKYLSAGELFQAKNMVICTRATGKETRRVVVEKDEIVEFRYPCDAHFRTTDDVYLVLSEEQFLLNFTHYGTVFDEIRFLNRNTLKQILDCRLYKESQAKGDEHG